MSVKKGQQADIFSGASMLYVGLAALVMCLLAIFYLTGNMDLLAKMADGVKSSGVVSQQTDDDVVVKGLMDELKTTEDDGGEPQVQQLKNDARGL